MDAVQGVTYPVSAPTARPKTIPPPLTQLASRPSSQSTALPAVDERSLTGDTVDDDDDDDANAADSVSDSEYEVVADDDDDALSDDGEWVDDVDEEPPVLRITDDGLSPSPLHSPRIHSQPRTPLSLTRPASRSLSSGSAFAIFGREIHRIESPRNDGRLIPGPPPRKPRTVPPPLPGSGGSVSETLVPPPPLPALMTVTAPITLPDGSLSSVMPRARSTMSPYTPITPPTPATPASETTTPRISVVSQSTPSSPSLAVLTSPPPPPPALPLTGTHQRGSSAVPMTFARVSPAPPSSDFPTSPNSKNRASLPAGFQFSNLKLHTQAAPAQSNNSHGMKSIQESNSSSGSSSLSSSSPIPTTSGVTTLEYTFSPNSTAPSVLRESRAGHDTGLKFLHSRAASAVSLPSAPESPRRSPSSTIYSQSPVSESEALSTLSTASPSSAHHGGVASVASPCSTSAVSDSAATPAASKQRCSISKCLSLAVRGSYCLRHCYHAGLDCLTTTTTAFSSNTDTVAILNAVSDSDSVTMNDRLLKIADELFKTEKTYYESLKVAYQNFQLRLEVASEFLANPSDLQLHPAHNNHGQPLSTLLPIVRQEEIATIFSNLQAIYQLSAALYHDLAHINTILVHHSQSASSSQLQPTYLVLFLGSVLLHYASQFRLYAAYLENYDDSIRLLAAARERSLSLDVWIRWQEKCEGTSLDSLLILPIQRLPRYLLLIQELLKIEDTRTKKHPSGQTFFTFFPQSLADLEEARNKITRIADAINSSLHQKESAARVLQLQAQFERDESFTEFATPSRKLVKDGKLRKINNSNFNKNSLLVKRAGQLYHFFLFNDLFVGAEEIKKLNGKTVRYRLKYFIQLLDIEVPEPSSSSGGGGGDKEFILGRISANKSLKLAANSATDRQDWLHLIRECQQSLIAQNQAMMVLTFDGKTQQEKNGKANLNKAKLMMGV